MKKIVIVSVCVLGLIACATKDKQSTNNTDTTGTSQGIIGNNKSGNEAGDNNGNSQTLNPPATPDTANFTTIEWIDATTKDLGKLKKDKTIEITYRFKNNGDKNLIIENVTAQCGCTIPEKPQQPFAPGEEGVIKATFNGSGQGVISKQVYVTANTKPSQAHTLTFTGEIKQ